MQNPSLKLYEYIRIFLDPVKMRVWVSGNHLASRLASTFQATAKVGFDYEIQIQTAS